MEILSKGRIQDLDNEQLCKTFKSEHVWYWNDCIIIESS